MSLGGYLAGLRALHGNDYRGQQRENGVTVFGAYGMLLENWAEWSRAAGYEGADHRDPDMQDAVAGYWANAFFKRYGDWDLVGAAWYGGQDQADAMLTQGRTLFRDERMRQWQKALAKAREQMFDAPVPNAVASVVPPGAWLHPIAGASKYSNSFMPNTVNHRGRTHPAIDVYADAGTPIVAPASGKVVGVGYGEKGGHWVRVQDNKGLTYYFAHMAEPPKVKRGEVVGAGQHLGFVGNSGSARTTSPHLHFSIKKGNAYVNPYSFLQGSRNYNAFYEAPAAASVSVMPEDTVSQNLDQMLETVANTMAGGQRVDPRSIGIRPNEQTVEVEGNTGL